MHGGNLKLKRIWVNYRLCLCHNKEDHTSQSQYTAIVTFNGWRRPSSRYAVPTSPVPHYSRSATYIAHIDCSISINIAETFMDVPRHFFHWCKKLLSQHFDRDDHHWKTPIWKAAAEMSYVRNLCKFVHSMREVQTTWYNRFIAPLIDGKKVVGNYFFGHPVYDQLGESIPINFPFGPFTRQWVQFRSVNPFIF
jgi:hypothetical protein